MNIGLGILSWKGGETLKSSLESYQKNNFFSIFDENMVFLPEQREQETHIAKKYNVSVHGHPENLGILGGFKFIAENINSEYILILENDFHLFENYDNAKQQIETAYHLIQNNHADIVRLRSRHKPGLPFCGTQKFKKYYPDKDARLMRRMLAWILRSIMPYHTKRALGMIFYDMNKNPADYPDVFHFIDNIPITNSVFLPWTNNPCLVKRDFLLNHVIGYAENVKSKRRVNGFKNIEIEVNSKKWRKNQYKIALLNGIFTHYRVGHRGY
jgi:hypothetical protein